MATTKNPPVVPASTSTATAAVSNYPGAFGLFKPSSQAIRLAFVPLLLIYVILFAIGIVIGLFSGNNKDLADSLGSILNIVSQVITIPMFSFIILYAVRGTRKELRESFDYATQNILRFFIANLLAALAVIGGLILLIIPGILIAMKFSMTNYILVDNPKMSGTEALSRSWDMTKGHMGKIFGIIGVSILMLLPVITIVGIIATVILLVLYAAAMPVLYNYLVGKQKA